MKKTSENNILIVGAPARYSDLRYATGFFSFDPVIFLKTRQGRFLIVSPLDFGHVRRLAATQAKLAGGTVKNMAILSSSDFPVARNSKTPSCDRIIGLLKKKNIRSVTVPPYFPIGLARQLTGKGVTVSVAEGNIFTEREIKTAKEIQSIIHAQKAAGHAMDTAIAMIAGAGITRDRSLKIGSKPLTSEAVRNAIDNAVRDYGCVCYGTIVAGGKQSANPHETGWGTLKADEPIVIDIFPQHIASGYWGDLTRTVIRGKPSPEIQKMYSAVRAAQRAAILKIKAGVTAEKIHNTAVELFKKRGFITGLPCSKATQATPKASPRRERVLQGKRGGRNEGFIHGIGHGVGLEIHENPYVGPVETRLKEGNVITVEPGLYYHRRAGIRIEDIVLVTQNAGRILAQYHCQFII